MQHKATFNKYTIYYAQIWEENRHILLYSKIITPLVVLVIPYWSYILLYLYTNVQYVLVDRYVVKQRST